MKDIWVISDTHFQHKTILKFVDNDGKLVRPGFVNSDEMDQYMIERWNSVVKPGDKVYHLGDVFFGNKENFEKIFSKLHGQKRLIVGNHDNIKYLASTNFFQKIQLWRQWREEKLMFSHVPLHISSLDRGMAEGGVLLNIHGHIHQNDSPPGPYYNVCVEKTDYTPIHIDILIDKAKEAQNYV